MRLSRLIALLMLAVAAGLATDWLRDERVLFSPRITTEPAP
jgi:hypothetical protein